MALIRLNSFSVPAANLPDGDNFSVRFWYNYGFIDSAGQSIQPGSATSGTQIRTTASVSDGFLTVDDVQLFTTVDAQSPFPQSITLSCQVFKNNSALNIYPFNQLGCSSSWIIYNPDPNDFWEFDSLTFLQQASQPAYQQQWMVTNQEMIAYVNSLVFANAGELTKGVTYLDVDPDVLIHPTAVGVNSPLITTALALASASVIGRTRLDVDPDDPDNPIAVGINSPLVHGASTFISSDYADLATAVTEIGATSGTLLIVAADFPSGISCTVPSTLVIDWGALGTLDVVTGVTSIILSDTSAYPLRKIFYNATAGLGTISFAGNQTSATVYPEWWGISGVKLSTPISSIVTTTSGSTTAGSSSLSVVSGTSFATGDVVKITGAGPSGGVYRGVIASGGGTGTWDVVPSTFTTIAGGATVQHGDNNITTLAESAASDSITVASTISFNVGDDIYIAGGGAAAGGSFLPHIARITDITDLVLTFTPALITSISDSTLVMHDETSVIQATINAAMTMNTGRVVIPTGIHMVNRPEQTSSGGRAGVLLLPEESCCTDSAARALVIEGAGPEVANLQPSFIAYQTTTQGTIIQSDTAGNAILSGSTALGLFPFIMMRLTLHDLHFRLYDNPQAMALDLFYVNGITAQNVSIDTGTQSAVITEPTDINAIAVNTPGPSNGGASLLSSMQVAGFYKGFVMGEHTNITETLAVACLQGYNFPAANYPITIGAISTNQCPTPIQIDGAVNICGGLLKAERQYVGSVFPSWTDFTYDVVDTGNLAVGYLNGFGWLPPGSAEFPVKNGGARLDLHPQGTLPNGSLDYFSDAFGTAALETYRWGIGTLSRDQTGLPSGTVVQTGGQLVITPESSVAAERFQGVVTQERYNMIGCTMTVKVTQVASNTAQTRIMFWQNETNMYGVTQVNGSGMTFFYVFNDSFNIITTTSYNAVTHLWWRLRQAAQSLFFDTSPDNVTWTNHGSQGGMIFVPNRTRLSLEAGVTASEATPGTAIFDDFSIG